MASNTVEKRPRVLLMEPAEPHRRLLDAVLTHAGFEVIKTTSWEQASFVLQSPELVDLLVAELEQVPGACRGRRLEAPSANSFNTGWGQAMTGTTDSGVPCYLSIGRPPSVREMVTQIRLLLQETSATKH